MNNYLKQLTERRITQKNESGGKQTRAAQSKQIPGAKDPSSLPRKHSDSGQPREKLVAEALEAPGAESPGRCKSRGNVVSPGEAHHYRNVATLQKNNLT